MSQRVVSAKRDDIRRILRQWLDAGKYKSGDRLPPESELVRQLGCSRGTLREAVALLIHEGLLSSVRGSGTYVANTKSRRLTFAVVLHVLGAADVAALIQDSEHITIPLLDAIVAEANKHNAQVLLYVDNSDTVRERYNLLDLIDRQVDGAIVFYIGNAENVDCLGKIQDAGIPLVLVDRYTDQIDVEYVVTDNFKGAYDAVNAILELGLDNIYYVSTTEHATSVRDRLVGFTQAVNDHGLPCNIVMVNVPWAAGINIEMNVHKCILKSLEAAKKPLAILSVNAGLSRFVGAAVEDLGIPHDQFVLGHFDHPAYDSIPDFCTIEVAQPLRETGEKCVQILVDKTKGSNERFHVTMAPNIIVNNRSALVTMPHAESLEVSAMEGGD